jgi:hypothetical protein
MQARAAAVAAGAHRWADPRQAAAGAPRHPALARARIGTGGGRRAVVRLRPVP